MRFRHCCIAQNNVYLLEWCHAFLRVFMGSAIAMLRISPRLGVSNAPCQLLENHYAITAVIA